MEKLLTSRLHVVGAGSRLRTSKNFNFIEKTPIEAWELRVACTVAGGSSTLQTPICIAHLVLYLISCFVLAPNALQIRAK